MDVQGALTLSRQNGAGTVSNAGTLTKSGSGTSNLSIPLSNTGVLDLQAGILDLNSTFTHADNAVLRGISTLDISGATVTFNGDIEPGTAGTPGVLTITGALALTGTSNVNIDILGASVGSGYDQLAISGALTIAGALNLDRGTFDPTIPTTFPVITYGSLVSGDFDPVTGTGPFTDWQFTTLANTNSYDVTASAWP
jgi:hypothetical protein